MKIKAATFFVVKDREINQLGSLRLIFQWVLSYDEEAWQ